MTYRDLRQAYRDIDRLQTHLTSAILADNTRDAKMYIGMARRAAVLLDRRLHQLVERRSEDTPYSSTPSPRRAWLQAVGQRLQDSLRAESNSERLLVQSARRAIDDLINCTQRVELATTITQMRKSALACKGLLDYADAYLALAMGLPAEVPAHRATATAPLAST